MLHLNDSLRDEREKKQKKNKSNKVYILNYLNNLIPMIWVATQSDGINRVLKNSIAKYIPI